MQASPAQGAVAELVAWLRAAPIGAFLELAPRLGYVARGAVYFSIGAVALLAALDLAPSASGPTGAMQAWAKWPAGMALIWLAGAGLAAFAVWRGMQAVFDADRHGTSPHALAVRGGQAISGLVHAALAFSAFELIDGLEDMGEDAEAVAAARAVLAWPGGDWLLIGVGGFVLTVGLANVIQGLAYDFTRRLDCSPAVCRWALPLGRAGYIGRGVAFAPLGFFTCRAGLEARAGEVRSLGGALQTLEAQPFGEAVLALTALGLAAFGLFALVEARWRRINPPPQLTP